MSTEQGAFKLVELRLKGKTTNHDDQSAKDFGELWQKFEAYKIFDLIPGKLSNEIYAVYFDYEGDEKVAYFGDYEISQKGADRRFIGLRDFAEGQVVIFSQPSYPKQNHWNIINIGERLIIGIVVHGNSALLS